MSDWVPINENHAISVMTAFVQFAQPLPELAFRKALKGLDSAAAELGLNDIKPTSGMQISISPDGSPMPTPVVLGRMFSRNAEDVEDGAAIRVVEQLQFEPQRAIYRTWDYISWDWHRPRIQALLKSTLTAVDGVVGFGIVGMEYVDRFSSSGDGHGANLEDLLRTDSDLIAPHIFHTNQLFHSHSGSFVNDDPERLQLQNVKIEASDEADCRWVNIVTRQEIRYAASLDENPDAMLVLDQAHSDLKDMLARIITPKQAHRIYLKGS